MALLLNGYGLTQGTQLPAVHEHEVTLPRLPPALDGLRIGVMADIHATPVNNAVYVQGLVDRLNAAQPDMVLLPGNLIDGDAPEPMGQYRSAGPSPGATGCVVCPWQPLVLPAATTHGPKCSAA